MRLSIQTKPARAAARCAVAARVLLGLAVDMPATRNGAWLSALIGALLAAPWLLCLRYVRRDSRLLRLGLGLVSALDAGAVLAALTRSAGYLALDRASPALLLIPAGLALLWCVWKNGDAIGYAGMIWSRLALAGLAIVAVMQARYFRPQWLTPVLGEGWDAILDGGVRTAGWIVAASAILMICEEDGPRLGVLAGVGAAAALIALAGMLTPTRTSGSWIIRLDDLLCNGRAPLYLQLPMIALWFAGLMHLLACQCFAAAALLERLTGLDGRLCGALAAVSAAVVSRLDALPALSAWIAGYGFLAAAILTAAAARMPKRTEEGVGT